MNNIINGKLAADTLKKAIKKIIEEEKIEASLAVIQIGDNKASDIYVRNKRIACETVGIKPVEIKFPETISQELVVKEIEKLNNDPKINGILIQLPLPLGFDEGYLVNKISPLKDVDGLTYPNVGNLTLENDCLVPCTPLGVMELLKEWLPHIWW